MKRSTAGLIGLGALGALLLGWVSRHKVSAMAGRAVDWARGRALPCTSFAASSVLEAMGKVPTGTSSSTSWAALYPDLWNAISITDWSQPWSGIEAVAKLTGTPAAYGSSKSPPELADRVWYLAQLWWADGDPDPSSGDKGHSKLVRREGSVFRVRDSNEERGYMEQLVTQWWDGAQSGVAPLPGQS